jgi:hypothetical protein
MGRGILYVAGPAGAVELEMFKICATLPHMEIV